MCPVQHLSQDQIADPLVSQKGNMTFTRCINVHPVDMTPWVDSVHIFLSFYLWGIQTYFELEQKWDLINSMGKTTRSQKSSYSKCRKVIKLLLLMMVGLVAGGPPACLIRKLRQGIGGIEEWGRVNIEREETVGKKKTDPDSTHSGCVGWFGNFSFNKLSSRDVRIEFL